jgi:hypothetical protein
MRITDRDVLDQLMAHFKSAGKQADACAAAAQALGLDGYPQFYQNWSARGVPRGWRYAVWMTCRDRGIDIDKDWCKQTKTPAERKALAKSLQWVAPISNNGARHGEASAGKRQDQRAAAQRRSATGRSVRASSRQDQAGSRQA